MLIPIRCFTCGRVLADKWRYFEKRREEMSSQEDEETKPDGTTGTRVGGLLDELGLHRICCRRIMLGTVPLIQQL